MTLLRPLVIVRGDQHIARFGTIGRADNTFGFEQVKQPGGASVANFQPTLQERSGGFTGLDTELAGVVKQLIVTAIGRVIAAAKAKWST
jgi:hypothetical protein